MSEGLLQKSKIFELVSEDRLTVLSFLLGHGISPLVVRPVVNQCALEETLAGDMKTLLGKDTSDGRGETERRALPAIWEGQEAGPVSQP
tara:strand:+ start:800 stop:1066 length:267 start_codon:yes stop_codon:yes gene_type:complete